MSEFVSVKEFARRAGVSPQAVYKQLNNKLQGYWQLQNGKKVIDLAALSVFVQPVDNAGCTTSSTTVEQLLIEQLKKKDEQIAALTEALADAQRLADQAQRLQAVAEKKVALLEAPKHRWPWQRKKADEETV